MATWRHRMILYLEAKGCTEHVGRPYSRHYVRYSNNRTDSALRYYHIGKGGSCLMSRTPALTNAISISDMVKRQVEHWEGTQHDKSTA